MTTEEEEEQQVIEMEEEQPVVTGEVEAELADKLKKLVIEVIDKGRIDLRHGADILSGALEPTLLRGEAKTTNNGCTVNRKKGCGCGSQRTHCVAYCYCPPPPRSDLTCI